MCWLVVKWAHCDEHTPSIASSSVTAVEPGPLFFAHCANSQSRFDWNGNQMFSIQSPSWKPGTLWPILAIGAPANAEGNRSMKGVLSMGTWSWYRVSRAWRLWTTRREWDGDSVGQWVSGSRVEDSAESAKLKLDKRWEEYWDCQEVDEYKTGVKYSYYAILILDTVQPIVNIPQRVKSYRRSRKLMEATTSYWMV